MQLLASLMTRRDASALRKTRNQFIEITVKSTVEGTPCHRCGKMTTQLYGEDREITVRHLPILGRKTFIRLRPKRYQCLHCHGNPTTTQTLSWYTPRSAFTQAYEKQILLSLVNSTVAHSALRADSSTSAPLSGARSWCA